MVSNDMTFWMVQKHELKFWQTGNAWEPSGLYLWPIV